MRPTSIRILAGFLFCACLLAFSAACRGGQEDDGSLSGEWTEKTACILAADETRAVIYLEGPGENAGKNPGEDGIWHISVLDAVITDAAGRSLTVDDLTAGQMIRFSTNGVNDLLYPPTYETDDQICLLGEENPALLAEGTALLTALNSSRP